MYFHNRRSSNKKYSVQFAGAFQTFRVSFIFFFHYVGITPPPHNLFSGLLYVASYHGLQLIPSPGSHTGGIRSSFSLISFSSYKAVITCARPRGALVRMLLYAELKKSREKKNILKYNLLLSGPSYKKHWLV